MNRWLSGQVFWPLTERMMRRDTLRRFRQLTASGRWSVEKLRACQNHKLRRLLQSAARHCPYYERRFRVAGLDAAAPDLTAEDLRRLPLLTRDEIREHLDEMSWMTCPRGGARPYSTGGSSGEPLKFYFDRSRQSADWAARWRARSWWDIRPGDSEIMLWGAPIELKAQDRLRTWRDRLLNQRVLNAFDMTAAQMDAYVAAIQRTSPACVYGYPSSLALLARHAFAEGRRPGGLGARRLRAVFVTGEVVQKADRASIEETFGAPVVVEYGCRDGGVLACECRSGLLHVPEENVIVEVLDATGRPAGIGEAGEVVITNLDCLATPMIRYRTGDMARPGGRGCTCGLTSQTLIEVMGRKTDQIICRGPTGLRRMHALSLIYVLREVDGLRQFRIIQRSLDALEVEIVPGTVFTPDVERAVLRGLKERVGSQMDVRVIRRERIAPVASGKHACVVSEVGQEEAILT